jgi:hypothetical protein
MPSNATEFSRQPSFALAFWRQRLHSGICKNVKTIRDYFPEFAGAEMGKRFYGRFPTLHDCEVLAIRLDRELQEDFSGPTVTIDFYVFDSEVDPSSSARRPAKHQNAFSDLRVEDFMCERLKRRRLRFCFGEGWTCELTAARVRVVDIQPFTPTDWFSREGQPARPDSAG